MILNTKEIGEPSIKSELTVPSNDLKKRKERRCLQTTNIEIDS